MHVYSTHTRPSLVKVFCLCNSANKILTNKFSLTRCKTDAKHDEKTNFVHCCEFVAVEIIGCVRPAQLVRWLDAGHACVKGLWNYQQLEHINQWESRDQRESPSFPFLFLPPFAWFSTKRDWTHWRKKMLHKFTIWFWFDVNRPKGNRGDFSKLGFFIDDWR